MLISSLCWKSELYSFPFFICTKKKLKFKVLDRTIRKFVIITTITTITTTIQNNMLRCSCTKYPRGEISTHGGNPSDFTEIGEDMCRRKGHEASCPQHINNRLLELGARFAQLEEKQKQKRIEEKKKAKLQRIAKLEATIAELERR